jgi:hypothetical protein
MSNYVLNSKGEREPFSFRKVYRSARRAGASGALAKEIAQTIKEEASPDIKTSEIFERVRKLLSKQAPKSALRFPLKKAIFKLGPTGFPFEKYIGEVFSRMGYKTKLNQEVPGFCCRYYEIDFVAEKDGILYIGECKYRNLPGGKVHSDTALSNHARFLDIKKGKHSNGVKSLKVRSLLVTNTKFTNKAINYSNCVGVELLGWNYPRRKGLEYLIESQKLYPITILPSLRRSLADIFVRERMMLAQDLLRIDIERFSRKTRIPSNRLEALTREARILLG